MEHREVAETARKLQELICQLNLPREHLSVSRQGNSLSEMQAREGEQIIKEVQDELLDICERQTDGEE